MSWWEHLCPPVAWPTECAVCGRRVDRLNDYCCGCGIYVCVGCIFAPPKATVGKHTQVEHYKPRFLPRDNTFRDMT